MSTHVMENGCCTNCGKMFEANTNVDREDNRKPVPDDFSICLYCGHVMAFDKDLKIRDLTDKELVIVSSDERIIRAKAAIAELNAVSAARSAKMN